MENVKIKHSYKVNNHNKASTFNLTSEKIVLCIPINELIKSKL